MPHDSRGFPVTTESAEAAAALDRAVHNFLHWRAAVVPEIKAALKADPECALAQAVGGLLLHGARDSRLKPKIDQMLQAAQAAATGLSARERLYVAALEASAAGRIAEAVAIYETILAEHPTDLLAQRLAQMELFWLGEMAWSADISARVAPAWEPAVPDYGIFLACRAFDLEETQRFDAAERIGREAVERDPTDVWGAHAVAHVLFMQGRHADGVQWLDGLKQHWAEANQMALHLWWHRALFHLERREPEAALAIHDDYIRNRDLPLLQSVPDLYIDLQNGASMLLRLELMGVDVGHRWDEMAELARQRLDDHTSPFTSAHFAAILAAAGHFLEAGTLVRKMRDFAAEDSGTLGPRYATAAVPAAEAAIAHRKGDDQRVVDLLFPARRMLWQMGGSHAQRDLFFLLLADAARRVGRGDILPIVRQDLASAGFAEPQARVGYEEARQVT